MADVEKTIQGVMKRSARTGHLICRCGRGYASEFDGRCGLCRSAEIRRRKKKGLPIKDLIPTDPFGDADLEDL